MNHTIAVFGLGYVGCVSVACLAKLGHRVVGVDLSPEKVALVNSGKPTIVEEGIESLLHEQHVTGRVSATSEASEAVAMADVSLISVGTPSGGDGYPDLSAVLAVGEQIGRCLRAKTGFHTVALRSTVPPGSCGRLAGVIEGASGRVAGRDFAVVSNPEFLREGTGIQDYFHPPFTLIGSDSERASTVLREVYRGVDSPIVETSREVAEIIKYVNNSYHALKVVFANEVAAICKPLNIDAHQVMELFCRDRQLNISPAYFRPGFAFGGSCLPKDLRAIRAISRQVHAEVPVLEAIARSNETQVSRALEMVVATGKKRIGVLGLAFKHGTDDLRESPVVELLERLLGKGYELMVHDENVMLSRLHGANKQYIESRFPHLARLLVSDPAQMRNWAEVMVATQKTGRYQQLIQEMLATTTVVDLVRVFDQPPESDHYQGIGW